MQGIKQIYIPGASGCVKLGPPAVMMLASDGLTLSGGSGTCPTVTSDSLRVGVEGIDSRGTVRQLHCHLSGLVVGTHSMIGFNVGRLQDGFLFPWGEKKNRKNIRIQHSLPDLGASHHWLFTSVLTPPTTNKLAKAGSCFAYYHVPSFHKSTGCT